MFVSNDHCEMNSWLRMDEIKSRRKLTDFPKYGALKTEQINKTEKSSVLFSTFQTHRKREMVEKI